ncbi:helix-turn-helix transcriptional regulator [Nocardia nova]|uniref:helix-turn-helix transcriptional regulator n=1 Tax=Nocardia nova TaxID=37330 RepID=UPI0033EC6B57
MPRGRTTRFLDPRCVVAKERDEGAPLFVERRSQLVTLERIHHQCIAGKGGISLISGPVGSGKTELLEIFAEQLSAAGTTILEAVGSPRECDQAFGILQQLFAGLRDRADYTRVRQLLSDSASRLAGPAGERDAQVLRNHANQELWAMVRRLSAQAPVAIIVDDLHYADLASLQSLLYFSGRLRSARVMIIGTRTDLPSFAGDQRAVLVTELLRRPRFHLLRTGPLTVDGVRETLAERIGVPVGPGLAESWHRLTGGSPFLLRALTEDNGSAGLTLAQRLSEPVAGVEFAKAALACAHRGCRRFLEAARCLAVLAESGSFALLPRLIGEDEATAAAIVQALTESGILDGQRYRHPAARTAVLGELGTAERAELHRRVADLLYDDDRRPDRIAVHLVAAADVREPWAFEILLTAAREALKRDDPEFAAKCLRTAEPAAVTAKEQVALAILRIHVESHSNPDNITESVATVLEAVRAGRVPVDQMVGLLNPLLWQGRAGAATTILERIEQSDAALDDRSSADLTSIRTWMRSTHPGLLAGAGRLGEPSGGARVRIIANRSVRGPGLLADVLEIGPTEHTVPTAEWLLQTTRLSGPSLPSIVSALLALIHADRVDLAERWCDSLLRESAAQDAETWQALLTGTRAEIAIRRGDMVAARRHGLAALELIPRQAWGVALGTVISRVLIAATALGDWQTAGDCLIQLPDAVFDTRYGVQFLYARGRRLLAGDRLRAALDDLSTCGRLMGEWGIDQPTFLPWRADAVAVLLRLGRERQAAELAAEQLGRTNARQPRAYGIALRTVAAAERDDGARRDLLLRAIESLENSPDRMELAYALADLGDVQVRLGEPRRARQTAQRATRLAEELSLEPLLHRLDIGRRPIESVLSVRAAGPEDGDSDVLSAAERRVVMLAAGGRTNREIAAELYITVSTVEQHLTRVYRKLRVKGRGDLAAYLHGGFTPRGVEVELRPRTGGQDLGRRGAA